MSITKKVLNENVDNQKEWILENIGKIENYTSKEIKQNFSNNDEYNQVNNFNDENRNFEYSKTLYNGKVIAWELILKENEDELWIVRFSVKNDSIYIDSLISYKKWSWTKLIKKLVEISESLWKWWHIEATAAFFIKDWSIQKTSYRNQLTNLGFYYKLWFKAKNLQTHKLIQEYIDKWEEIPLELNRANIYLSDEWIQKLKNI